MKDITRFLLALACLLLPAAAFAQLSELRFHTMTIGATATSITPDDQWYLVYNKRGDGGYWWDHNYSNDDSVGSDEDSDVMFMSLGPDVVMDGMLASDAAEWLVRFIKVESSSDTYDEYYIQFGSGNYVWAGSGRSTRLRTVATIEEATTLYAYCINNEAGHFSFLTTDGGLWKVDNNGSGKTVVLYDQGEASSSGGNDDFTLYPVYLDEISERDAAILECEYVYSQYAPYSGTFVAGTTAGCCDPDAVEAFEAALVAAAEVDGPNADNLSIEEINALAQALIDAYEAVVASMIPRQVEVEDGYYFLTCGLVFHETTSSYEDPETGSIIQGETIDVTKAMYSDLQTDGTIYAKWNTLERTAPFLWKITAMGDLEYQVVNVATNSTFDEVARSTNVTMTVGGENLMAFDVNQQEDLEGTACIRVSTQAEDGSYYLHCASHSNGSGKSGYIVGWNNTEAPSIWNLELVSAEEAQAIIDEYASNLNAQAVEIITDAEEKMAIAEDVVALITDVSQLSSPYTDASEGSLANLIDGDASTFWHSDWHNGSVPYGTHYLQVEVEEEYEEMLFKFTRRSANENHITEWGIYGVPSGSPDADKDNCTFLAEMETPYTDRTETITSDPFPSAGFTVFRFYIDGTTGEGQNGYGHMSEFQLYGWSEDRKTQKTVMGDIYTNLEAAVTAAKNELSGDISQETYDELKAAYDAFMAVFVDPTELRSALSDAKSTANGVVAGTNPGYWSDTDIVSSLNATISEATEYNASGAYTQTESDNYIEALRSQTDAVNSSVISVQEGKWYEIRYANLDEIEANGWSLSNGAANSSNPELYGKYIVVAELSTEDGMNTVDPLTQSDLDDICTGQKLYFQDKQMDILYEDYAKFRFINVGDTAYMMQNKATGLFLKAAGSTGSVTLDVHPTLFSVSALGYGENLLSAQRLDGVSQANLHAQLSQNVLVTWSTAKAGTNSGFFIEDIGEDVASDYEGTEFNMSIQYGRLYTFCYPLTLTATDGYMYGVYVDGTTITLAKIEGNTAEAGQPFVYVVGDISDYDANDEAEPTIFTHGYELEKTAQESGKLVGSYYSANIGAGKLLASGNGFAVTTSTASVSANRAYVNGDYDEDAVITIEFTDETFDGIEEALAAVSAEGDIYSIDGKLLGKGNLNTVKALGRGIYIVNGVKVAVK